MTLPAVHSFGVVGAELDYRAWTRVTRETVAAGLQVMGNPVGTLGHRLHIGLGPRHGPPVEVYEDLWIGVGIDVTLSARQGLTRDG